MQTLARQAVAALVNRLPLSLRLLLQFALQRRLLHLLLLVILRLPLLRTLQLFHLLLPMLPILTLLLSVIISVKVNTVASMTNVITHQIASQRLLHFAPAAVQLTLSM